MTHCCPSMHHIIMLLSTLTLFLAVNPNIRLVRTSFYILIALTALLLVKILRSSSVLIYFKPS